MLKQLIDQGYVLQKEGANDRRQRLLYVTQKGETLALKLAGLQTVRITRALSPPSTRSPRAPPDAQRDPARLARVPRAEKDDADLSSAPRLAQFVAALAPYRPVCVRP